MDKKHAGRPRIYAKGVHNLMMEIPNEYYNDINQVRLNLFPKMSWGMFIVVLCKSLELIPDETVVKVETKTVNEFN